MSHLKLWLLGTVRLERHSSPIYLERRKCMALLAYLTVTQGVHQRAELATLLWPEYERSAGLAALRRTLTILKKQLGEPFLMLGRQEIACELEGSIEVDWLLFQQKLMPAQQASLPQARLDQLGEGVALYKGDFMAGFILPDAPLFDEWQWGQIEKGRQLQKASLSELVQGYEALGDRQQALIYAQQWVTLDPLDELAQTALVRLYRLTGQVASAVRQYERFCQQMENELGIQPDINWRALTEEAVGSEENQSCSLITVVTPSLLPFQLPVPLSSAVGMLCPQWEDIPEGTHALLHALSLFTVPFSWSAASAVTGVSENELRQLVNQEILVEVEQPDMAFKWLQIPPPLHQQVMHQFGSPSREVRQAYEAYYADFLERREPCLQSGQQTAALAEIQAELPHVRGAWYSAVTHQAKPFIQRMVSPLYLFYELTGLFAQGVADIDHALETGATGWGDGVNGQLLIRRGMLLNQLGDWAAAVSAFQAGLKQIQHGSPSYLLDEALALLGLGWVAWQEGRLVEAKVYLQASLPLIQSLGQVRREAQIWSLLANVACAQKQFEEALRLDQKSLHLYESVEDSLGMATCLNNLSHLAEQAGDYDSAGAWLNEALLRSRMASSWWLTAVVLANLGYIAQKQQRPHQALRYFQDSLILRITHHLPGQEEMRNEIRRFSPPPSLLPA